MQEEASRSQGAQQSSNEYKGYLESLRDEVGKLKSAVENTAGVSQELSVRACELLPRFCGARSEQRISCRVEE